MSDYPFFIPQVVLFANSSLFWFKVANEHREFRNYLNIIDSAQQNVKVELSQMYYLKRCYGFIII